MADVEIVTKMVDETGPASEKVTENLGKMKKESEKAGDAAKGFGKKINGLVTDLTGFNIAQIGATGAVVGLAHAMKNAVLDYSSYVESVDKAVQVTGMEAEEMSRLIQVADDFRVSQGALTGAMEFALKNGFSPTTENLALLADELKGIQDPTQRAEKLTKLFGRSYADIVPLLSRGGDAIRDAAAGIDEGLIVTEKAIETNRRFQASLDNLNDSWTAVKNTFAGDFLEGFTGSLEVLNTDLQMLQDGVSIFEVLRYNQEAYLDLERKMEGAKWAKDWGSDMREAGLAAKYASDSSGELSGTIDQLAGDVEAYKDAVNQAADAQSNLFKAQESYREGVGSDLVNLLKDAGIEGQGYKDALAVIDEAQGTNFATTERMNEEMAALVDKYKRTGDLAAFAEGVDNLSDSFEPFNKKVNEAASELQRVQNLLARLDGQSATITLNVVENGSIPVGLGGGSNKSNYVEKEAAGGNIRAGETVLVGEFGPEIFRPAMGGTISPTNSTLQGQGQSTTNQYQVQIILTSNDPKSAAEEIDYILGDRARMDQISGTQYQGR